MPHRLAALRAARIHPVLAPCHTQPDSPARPLHFTVFPRDHWLCALCVTNNRISQWREDFQVPDAFYAIVQLSTWDTNPQLLAQLRDQQLCEDMLSRAFFFGGGFG